MDIAGLTEHAAKTLSFVQGFIDTNGWSPSYQEISQALGFGSKATVARTVNSLIERGYLAKRPEMKRSITVLRRPSGAVAASDIVPPSKNTDRYHEIEEILLRSYLIFSGETPKTQEDMALRRLAVAMTALPDDQAVIHKLGQFVRVLTNAALEIGVKDQSAKWR